MALENGGLFRFQMPSLSIGSNARSLGIYLSGVLFACGFWFFMDAAIYSKVANAGIVHVTFVDWIPVICSSLGMLIVNSIDRSKLTGDNYGETSIAWKAKLVLFIGFALLAGGMAGGVVSVSRSRINGLNADQTRWCCSSSMSFLVIHSQLYTLGLQTYCVMDLSCFPRSFYGSLSTVPRTNTATRCKYNFIVHVRRPCILSFPVGP